MPLVKELKDNPLLAILVVIALGLGGWNLRETVNNTSRNSNTRLELAKGIGELREVLASIPREVPPAWFLDEVRELKHGQKEMRKEFERRFDDLERRIREQQ